MDGIGLLFIFLVLLISPIQIIVTIIIMMAFERKRTKIRRKALLITAKWSRAFAIMCAVGILLYLALILPFALIRLSDGYSGMFSGFSQGFDRILLTFAPLFVIVLLGIGGLHFGMARYNFRRTKTTVPTDKAEKERLSTEEQKSQTEEKL